MTKVIDIINQKKAPFASFELVPPLKGSDINKLYGAIEPLMEFAPPFINITFHRDEVEFRQTADGTFEKVTDNETVSCRSRPPSDLRRSQ